VLRNGANDGSLVLEAAQPDTLGALTLERMQKKIASGGDWNILVRSQESKMEIPALFRSIRHQQSFESR
jgi:hypothetical protein